MFRPKVMRCGHSNAFMEKFRICVACEHTLKKKALKYNEIKLLLEKPNSTTLENIKKVVEEEIQW
jgi:hypothetical protein